MCRKLRIPDINFPNGYQFSIARTNQYLEPQFLNLNVSLIEINDGDEFEYEVSVKKKIL